MATGVDQFRAIALSLPGAEEREHMGNPDFRVGGRIFATLSGLARGRGVLKLSAEQQTAFVSELPDIFEPVQGGWGRMGMTYVILDRADEATMLGSLLAAHKNVVAKKSKKSTSKKKQPKITP